MVKSGMAKKTGLNVYVDPAIAARLRAQAKHYDGQLGVCLSAAILLFLESSPQEQAAAMQRVYAASLEASVESLVEEIRAEQARRTSQAPAKPKRAKGKPAGNWVPNPATEPLEPPLW